MIKMKIIKNKLFQLLIIAFIGIAVYSNSFHSPFQYDDKHVIQWNRTVKSIDNLPGMLASSYRPVLQATFALNYNWFGTETFGYHVFNTLIHILNGILVYFLVSLISRDKTAAFLAGLFFVVHPLNTQAVNYISARSTSLCAVFYILSVIFFIKANNCREKGKVWKYYAGSFIGFVLAIGSKEIAVSIPVMLFAYHCVFLKGGARVFIKKYSLFILFAGGYLLYRVVSTGTIGDYSTDRGLITTVLTNMNAMVYENLKLLFFPVNLNVAYEFPEVSSINFPVVFSAVVIVVLLVIAYRTMKTSGYLSFSILWFFIILIPTQTFVAREEIICEHRLYLACVSVCMFLAVSLARLRDYNFTLFSKKTAGKAITGFTVTLLVLFAAGSHNRNLDWQSEISLWKRMAESFPGSYKAHSNLGNSYAEKGMYEEAVEHYEILLKTKPDDAKASNNLANIYYLTGKYDRAIEKYRKAIGISPGYLTAHGNLAMAYEKKNMPEEALKVYQGMLGISPGNATVFFKMGNVFQLKKSYDEAINYYKKAVGIRPDYAEVYNNLGNSYFYKGWYDEAIKSYRKALELDPSIKQARDNIGLARERIKK